MLESIGILAKHTADACCHSSGGGKTEEKLCIKRVGRISPWVIPCEKSEKNMTDVFLVFDFKSQKY